MQNVFHNVCVHVNTIMCTILYTCMCNVHCMQDSVVYSHVLCTVLYTILCTYYTILCVCACVYNTVHTSLHMHVQCTIEYLLAISYKLCTMTMLFTTIQLYFTQHFAKSCALNFAQNTSPHDVHLRPFEGWRCQYRQAGGEKAVSESLLFQCCSDEYPRK